MSILLMPWLASQLQFTEEGKKIKKQRIDRSTERKLMAMKVEKIFIKPSTPTPDHLRSFNLSLLDQLSPPVFVPIILFYPAATPTSTHEDQAAVSDQLKESLSKTLTRFYPLAGRIKDNLLVDCNDDGIEYFETRVNSNISDFMKRDQLHHLLPYDLQSTLNVIVDNDSQLIVQVNFFECGGIAISVCISHKITDAATLTTFLNTWASTTCDAAIPVESVVSPTFDSAILYPPREGMSSSFSGVIDAHFTGQAQVQAEKLVTRRFVIDGTKIATLRAKYSGGSNDEKTTTRVEAVTALIWKTAMAASSSPKPSVANISVEMRRRLDPPLPEQSLGNLATLATAVPSVTEGGELNLVGPLRESIRKINNDSLKMLQGDEGFLKFQEFMKMAMETYGKLEVYTFTSWCRFPLYEADFGWGKPNWVTIGSQPFKNTSVLMDTRTGDGIEAWICLVEEDMAIFKRDQELLEFISFLD